MPDDKRGAESEEEFIVIKRERMPNGKTKLILKDKKSKKIFERVVSEEKGQA
jgi:hypothetical protein